MRDYKTDTVKYKIQLLNDFCVPVTDDIVDQLRSLESDPVKLEMYTSKLINDFLSMS